MSGDEELREGMLEGCIPTRAEFYGCGVLSEVYAGYARGEVCVSGWRSR